MVYYDENNLGNYGCSFFITLDEIHRRTKFPTRNKAIAKGKINQNFGPIEQNNQTSHINLYVYDGVDPSNKFEVVEKWEKNGLV